MLLTQPSVTDNKSGRAPTSKARLNRLHFASNTLVVIYGTANQTHGSARPPRS
jgi:hypothetical protein